MNTPIPAQDVRPEPGAIPRLERQRRHPEGGSQQLLGRAQRFHPRKGQPRSFLPLRGGVEDLDVGDPGPAQGVR